MTQPPASEPTAPTDTPTCYRHPGRETYISCQRCGRPICPDCMRDAAVGFQCPACVTEGRKSTRTGRTAYGGTVSRRPGLVTNILIGLNALVWLAITATGRDRSWLIDVLALRGRGICTNVERTTYRPNVHAAEVCHQLGERWSPGATDGAVWQVVTSMFSHVAIWHIAMNMYALFVLGPVLEQLLGRWRFLALYVLSGLAGSAAVLFLTDPDRSTLGASGAIFGLMGATFLVALKARSNVSGVLQVLVINGAITVFGASFISWQGHLGGFLGGLAAGAVLIYAPRARRTHWQVIGLLGVAVVIAGLLALGLTGA